MKQIQYNLEVKHKGDPDTAGWTERVVAVVEDDITCHMHATKILEDFNAFLRPNEKARELIGAAEIPLMELTSLSHNWEKKSLVTQRGGYDVMKCSRCGALGKRHGLGPFVALDKKYIKNFSSCPWVNKNS